MSENNREITRTKWYEKEPGNTSMMRIATMISTIVGSLVIITAIICTFIVAYTSNELLVGVIGSLLTSGPIIIGAGEVSKSIQANGENRSLGNGR